MSGKPFNTVAPADYRFWELLNQVVQEEPSESLDQIRLGYYASIGIQKGKPFNDQRFPSVSSQTKGLLVNADGSVDIYFGTKPPAGKENNWVQTIPETGWNTILRLYGPLEPWFNKTWRPGEIELLK